MNAWPSGMSENDLDPRKDNSILSPSETISAEQIDFEESDALADEIASFVDTVRTRGTPPVTALDGLRALEICEKIKLAMEAEEAASAD